MKTAIVGGGNMGSIIARAMLEKKVVPLEDLLIVEQDPERCQVLKSLFPCAILNAADSRLSAADVVILAVKPQDAAQACRGITPYIKPEQLVLSIMAGVAMASLNAWLSNHKLMVRAMPNLPMQVGKGMTVYCCDSALEAQHLLMIERLLNCSGISLRVEQEELLNAATAISGTGPAYLYYFLECFLLSAAKLGFSPAESHLLVRQTLEGAVEMWDITGIAPGELRRMVTSRGGTTAAAMAVFDSAALAQAFERGVMAAHRRAAELGEG